MGDSEPEGKLLLSEELSELKAQIFAMRNFSTK